MSVLGHTAGAAICASYVSYFTRVKIYNNCVCYVHWIAIRCTHTHMCVCVLHHEKGYIYIYFRHQWFLPVNTADHCLLCVCVYVHVFMYIHM